MSAEQGAVGTIEPKRTDQPPTEEQPAAEPAAPESLAGAAVDRAAFMTGGWLCLLASANFGGLVLASINADFCNQILVLQHFSRSS